MSTGETLRRWQQANAVKIAEKSRQWREANVELGKENRRKYRETHRAASVEASRRWRLAHPDKHKESQRKYLETHPNSALRVAERGRLNRYGLTASAFSDLIESQDGLCDICAEPMEEPHVDHDHVTGRVRGLLCLACNTGMGFLKDDPENLRAAVNYLERSA